MNSMFLQVDLDIRFLSLCLLSLWFSIDCYAQDNAGIDKLETYTYIDTISSYDGVTGKQELLYDTIKISYHTRPDVMPILRSCENSPDMDPDGCTKNKLKDLMRYNLVYPQGIENKRLDVIKLYFVVKEDGFIAYLEGKSKGNRLLIAEAMRVMNLINAYVSTSPFIPGKLKGKNVSSLMILPILFQNK